MDASRRSLHVYGKTQAGTLALTAMRGAMSTSTRQLLILIDGKRSIGELGKIFAGDTLAQALAQLESQGYIECLKHFPEEPDDPSAAPEPPAPPEAPEPPRAAAPAKAAARVEPTFDGYEAPPPPAAPAAGAGAAVAVPAKSSLAPAPAAAPAPSPAPSPAPAARAADAAPREAAGADSPPASESLQQRLYAKSKRVGVTAEQVSPPARQPAPDTAAPRTRAPAEAPTTRSRQAGDNPDRRTPQRGSDTLAPHTRIPGETLSPRTRAPDSDDEREARAGRSRPRPRRRSNLAIILAGTCIIAAYGGYQVAVRQAAGEAPTGPVPAPAAASDAAGAPAATAARAPAAPAPSAGAATPPSAPKAADVTADPPAALPAAPVAAKAAPGGAIVNLHVRNQVMPQLPQLAKALGIESGHVVVVLHVTPQGTVSQVELVSATPPQVYDQAMKDAFSQWTFDPPGVDGRMTVDVNVKPAGTP